MAKKSTVTAYHVGGRVTRLVGKTDPETGKRKSQTGPITGPELRAFRHQIALLNRQGLIPGKTVKASTAKPMQVRDGKHLYEWLRTYKPVLSGDAAAVKLPRAAVIEQHKMGHKTVTGGRVLIPKAPDERIVVTKSGAVERIDKKSGLKVIEIPGKFLDKAERDRAVEVANEMGGGKKYWGYKIAGNRPTQYFSSPKLMFKHLRRQYKAQFHGVQGFSKFFYDRISIMSSDNWHDLVKEDKPK